MNSKLYLVLIFAFLTFKSHGQKSTKGLFSPYKIGFQYNFGNEKSFLFDDPDYYYQSHTLKGQLFYPLTDFRKIKIDLVLQPQIQLIQHQLLNSYYVTPNIPNYTEKIARFIKRKKISLTALETSIHFEGKLFKDVHLYIQIGLGISYINTETERLAKGFTFIENGNIGFSIKTSSTTSIQIHTGIGHVSNFDFQIPNGGYNTFNSGIGFQYVLK